MMTDMGADYAITMPLGKSRDFSFFLHCISITKEIESGTEDWRFTTLLVKSNSSVYTQDGDDEDFALACTKLNNTPCLQLIELIITDISH